MHGRHRIVLYIHTRMFVKRRNVCRVTRMRRSKEDAEQTRCAILAAAEQVFCELGVADATLEKISRTAGVTRGALYWHFKDKQDLLRAVHTCCSPPQQALIRAAAEYGHDDPLGLLSHASQEVLELFETDEQRQRLLLIMSSIRPCDEASVWLSEANAEMFDLLSTVCGLARDKGGLNPEFTPEEATVLLMASMNGLLSEWLRSGKAFPLAALGGKILRKQIEILRATPP